MAFEILVEEALNFSIITLRNTTTKHEAEIYSFGALLNAFRFPFQNSTINIVDGFASPEDAKQHIAPFFKGAKLSPFVCRMKNGRYEFHGKSFQVEKYFLKEHALHALLYDAVFEIRESITDQEGAAVVLQHHYDGSDNGYPFEYDLEVEWRLSEGNMLSCTTRVSHTNPFDIPYADGWHPYFSLDTSVDDCYLQIDAGSRLEFDASMIPTGRIEADDRLLQRRYLRDLSLDDCFVLQPEKSQPRAVFSSEKISLTILPDPSYPYLQVFTPAHRKSIALENLSGAPDCFNNKIGLRMINPNETVTFSTHYIPAVIG